jgi:hypothetical protein
MAAIANEKRTLATLATALLRGGRHPRRCQGGVLGRRGSGRALIDGVPGREPVVVPLTPLDR